MAAMTYIGSCRSAIGIFFYFNTNSRRAAKLQARSGLQGQSGPTRASADEAFTGQGWREKWKHGAVKLKVSLFEFGNLVCSACILSFVSVEVCSMAILGIWHRNIGNYSCPYSGRLEACRLGI